MRQFNVVVLGGKSSLWCRELGLILICKPSAGGVGKSALTGISFFPSIDGNYLSIPPSPFYKGHLC